MDEKDNVVFDAAPDEGEAQLSPRATDRER
jgi:hypothetical protein